jgi:hypothetical protein
VQPESREAGEKVGMCEEGVTAVEDLLGLVVDFPAYNENLRIYWGIDEKSWDGERRYDKDLAVYLIADLAREI